jgi:hypothetical protein
MQSLDQPGKAPVASRIAFAAGLVGQGDGNIAFTGAGGTGDQTIEKPGFLMTDWLLSSFRNKY